MKTQLSLGIDTSNYKTSVAIVDGDGRILFNKQQFLSVKKGERGLRQSEALFQHVKQLPQIMEEAMAIPEVRGNIGCVSVSTRPRPIKGSYMPVFLAGESVAVSLAAALGVPIYRFSHQEGHIEAVRCFSDMRDTKPVICFHFSGGTTEAVLCGDNTFEVVGGSKDLAYGQVLDRIGVALGYDFPCGEALDRVALSCENHKNLFTKIKVKDGYTNLSGIETQAQRMIGKEEPDLIIEDLLFKLSASVADMTSGLAEKYEIKDFIYAGGVSCSQYMRNYLAKKLPKNLHIAFGKPELSSDNAVGTALLGGKNIWL